MTRILLILIIICFGCQTGRIPCPKLKGAKSGSHRRYRAYSASLTAKAEDKSAEKSKVVRLHDDEKYVQNVTVEDWDCPRPGAKKYLPKNVRENIRRNTKRMKEDLTKSSSDSTSTH